jgi:hypothetical protein
MRRIMLPARCVRFIALSFLLISGQGEARSQKPKGPEIVQGRGWGDVRLGAPRAVIERMLGKGNKRSKYTDVYFINYETKGVQVSFSNSDDAVVAIYFYNKDENYKHFATFRGKTSKGIGWDATVEQVRRAYGKPLEDNRFCGGRRIVFDGIDFRFLNGKMVRIGIPGK